MRISLLFPQYVNIYGQEQKSFNLKSVTLTHDMIEICLLNIKI